MKRNDKHDVLNETVINGSRNFIENGEVKTVLNENITKTGRMSIEDAQKLTIDKIKKILALFEDSKSKCKPGGGIFIIAYLIMVECCI